MADISIGDIVTRLRADTTDFMRGMQQAQQGLQQFAQAKDQVIQNLQRFNQAFSQAFAQAPQQMQALAQSAQQTTQNFTQFNQTFQQTNQAFQQVNNSAQQFTQTINNITNVTRQAGQTAQGLGAIWSSVFSGALSVAGGLGIVTSLQGAVSALEEFAESVVKVGVRMEQLRLGFAALFGGQAGGARAFEQLTTFANRYGLELLSLTDTYRRFSAATQGTALQGDRGQAVFQAFVLAGQAAGASEHQINQIGLAIEQMVSKGVISMEELRRQLGNALPGAFQIAARAMGVTTEELEKLIRKGHTEAIPFLEAMARELRTEFAPAAEAAANSAAAAFNRFGNELLQFKDMLAQTGIVEWLRDVANMSAEVLKGIRAIREEREKELGGHAPAVPAELAASPEIKRRQDEIEVLRKSLTPQLETGEMPDLSAGFARMGMTVEETRKRIIALQAEQQKIIDNNRRMQEAEQDVDFTRADPFHGIPDRIRKLFEEGQKQLRDIDLSGQFLPALDVADEKLKSWEKTLKAIRAEFDKIGPGLRQDLPLGQRPSPYDASLTQLAGERNIDPRIARALMDQESGGDPNVRSRAGAIGLMQLMPGTARQLQPGITESELREPITNIKLGLDYLAQLLKQFGGDYTKALTAYNAGPGHGGIPLATGENATFAQDVLRRVPRGPLDVIQQAEQQKTALEAGVESLKPDAQNAARIRETGKAVLAAYDQAIREAAQARKELPGMEALLGRVETFTGAPGQSAPEQARARIQQQGAELTASLQRGLEQIAENPELQKLAPDLAKRFQEALATIPDAVAQQGQIAFDRMQQQGLDRVAKIGEQIEAIGERLGSANLGPLEQSLHRVDQEFQKMRTTLLDTLRILNEMFATATPAGRAAIETQQEKIVAQLKELDTGSAAEIEKSRIRLEATVTRLQQVANTSAAEFEALKRGQETLESRPRDILEQQQLPFGESRETKQFYRQGLENVTSVSGKEQLEREHEAMLNQDRLLYGAQLFVEVSHSVESAWTSALQGIASGTQTVSEAFRAMAQSILQSMAQIASQEAFKAITALGLRLILGAATGGVTGGGGGGGGPEVPAGIASEGGALGGASQGVFAGALGFQHGGVVSRPTFAHLAEGGEPEAVVNRNQMGALMDFARSAGPSAGGQAAGGISIINVSSKEEASRQKLQQEALGRQVVINHVMSDLAQGEGSMINRTIRGLAR